jgi:N-acetyl-anhydromuramyl-L-alanine amidase AmpD
MKNTGSLEVRELASDHFEDRPDGVAIDTIIIHSMHNPKSEDKFSAVSCKQCLDECGVSAHYIIDLEGVVWRTVPEDKKAWHAGESKMPDPNDLRDGVNAFSLGIELIGTEEDEFTDAQYESLALLSQDIMTRFSICHFYGHSDIAPQRKTDPWGFDWVRFRKSLDSACQGKVVKFSSSANYQLD